MAVRKIVKIDEELCDGCGVCIPSCAEGALQIIDGKARLIAEKFCDGLGACLGDCPKGAITIEERESEEFDESAVEEHFEKQKENNYGISQLADLPCGCPGSQLQTMTPEPETPFDVIKPIESRLSHWPVQLRLVPAQAPFLKNADILICADCVPFAVPDFHSRYLAGKTVLVGCPKFDNVEYYRDKLKEIFAEVDPNSISVIRMDVPCCGGIVQAVLDARNQVVPHMPVEIHNISIKGGQGECTRLPAIGRLAGGEM